MGAGTLIEAQVPFCSSIRPRRVDEVVDLLAPRYARAIDVRDERELPVGELPRQLESIAAGGGRRFSDFLFLP